VGLALALIGANAAHAQAEEPKPMLVYIGTLGKESEGIYVMKMNPSSGELTSPMLAAKVKRPSFVAIHPSGNFLYACEESNGMGAVEGFEIHHTNGPLEPINSKSSGGKGACFVGVDHA